MTFSGVLVPLITPFAADGEIAAEALEGLAHAVLDGGASGLVALGTTAEAAMLTGKERRAVAEVCARVCREREATLVVGAGSSGTRGTAEALRDLAGAADAALVAVPSFVRPGEAGVLAHFTELSRRSPVPLIVYNVPHRTGQTAGAAALREIGALPMVRGVKQAVGGLDADTVALLADPPEDFAVLAGDDAFLSALLALGAPGGIVATAHLRTADFAALAEAWRSGDAARARALGHRLSTLAAAVFAESNPTVLKGVLHAQGLIPTPSVRLPLVPARRESVEAVLRLL
ncbi:dihydrodipicolinate synthase family protein [Planomonospora sp. ID82291]|uniref:dihydrodipicolinate synthase family protein n=1 Tax=Planomonospora sp. ID82291 TaxID=2738136 RepID=UPI0018C35463|nr:dihydrodipicolinate synthase family protein [Planomonospora sp. ID82291]MBG0817104.1 dihydrodipicolinate synthase family protein [Planomonospora sp. ID82291]